jgi:3-oxoacyl-[acyl-carrier-protein] synthase-3
MDEVKPERFGIPSGFIENRIGIIERRISDAEILPSDMAIQAGNVALQDAGINPQDIDCVIFCGIDGDWCEPATAHRVQAKLNLINAFCFDTSNACNGFMTGLLLADSMIKAGQIETALVVTGEKSSRVMFNIMRQLKNCTDNVTFRNKLGALTLGDAGGAMVVSKSNNGSGFLNFSSISDGKLAEQCFYKWTENGDVDGQMLMRDICKDQMHYQSVLIGNTYNILNWTPDDVDRLICHQMGRKPLENAAKITGVSLLKATKTYDYYGNVASASVPINFFLFPPTSGTKLLLLGMGSGLSVILAGLTF